MPLGLEKLSPTQRQALMFGVPAVALVALGVRMGKRDAPAEEETTPPPTGYLAPSTDAIGVGQLADFESKLKDYIDHLFTGPPTTTPPPTNRPPTNNPPANNNPPPVQIPPSGQIPGGATGVITTPTRPIAQQPGNVPIYPTPPSDTLGRALIDSTLLSFLPTLTPGVRRPAVTALTQALKMLGWSYPSNLAPGESLADRDSQNYDQHKVAFVQAFQSSHGLASNGTVDKETWRQIAYAVGYQRFGAISSGARLG